MAPSRIQTRLVCAAALIVAGVCACATLRSQRQPDSAGQSIAPAASAGQSIPAPARAPQAGPPQVSASAAGAAPATAPSGALLTVTIKGLRNRKGDLIFGVFTHADGFPNVQSKSVYWEVKPADADAVTFTLRLPPGRYAAGVLHDENRSGDMDKGLLEIPLEGYGVTNNPKPALRKATFDEAAFTLSPDGAAMTISLQYF